MGQRDRVQGQPAEHRPRLLYSSSAGATLVALLSPALDPELVEESGGSSDHGDGDGCGAADLPGAVAGRVVVDGEHRGLSSGGGGGARVRPLLHRPGHRGREGAAGEGAGGRCRCGRARGDRCGRVAGRDRARHRPAAGGGGPGAIAGRRVPLDRRRGGRRSRRPGTPRRWGRTTRPARRRCTPSSAPTSTSSSPRR